MALGITPTRMKVLVEIGKLQPQDPELRVDLFHVAKELGLAFRQQPTTLIAAQELKDAGFVSLVEDGLNFMVRLTKKGQAVYDAVARVLNPHQVAHPGARSLGQILRGDP
jgi:hypothetical protein